MPNIHKNQKVCDVCINATRSNAMNCHSFNLLTKIKTKNPKRYFFVNNKTFTFFIQMERIFRMFYKQVHLQKINLKSFFVTKYEEIAFSLPECHNLKRKIILRYHAFRMKIRSTKLKSNKGATYVSKSVAMHEYVK